MRTSSVLEYAVTTVLVLALAYLIVTPLVNRVAQSMDDSANMIAEASSSHYHGSN